MKSRIVFSAPNALGRVPRKAQRGVVLFIALIMLVAMTLSGIALVRSVDTTSVIAGNLAFKQGTLMATDLGVEAASQQLLGLVNNVATDSDDASKNYSASYNPANAAPTQLTAALATNVLSDVSGTGNTVRYWLERMCLATGAPTATGCIREEGKDAPYYRATTRVDGPRGTVAITQSTVQTPGQFVPQHALLTQGRLDLSSTISIGGNGGHVHSNTSVQMSGTTVLTLPTGTVSGVGTSTGSGTAGVYNSGSFTGGITQNAPTIDIPEFIPEDFEQYADFKLRRDCSVVNRAGTVLMAAAVGGKWLGWKCDPAGSVAGPGTPPTLANYNNLAKWTLEDSNSWSRGLLYVEGNVEVGTDPGNPGHTADQGPTGPWVVSIVATGNILLSGTPTMRDYRNHAVTPLFKYAEQAAPLPMSGNRPQNPNDGTLGPAPWAAVSVAVQNLFLVAGLDLRFNNVTQVGPEEGLMSAREQVVINGTSTLLGSILAADKYAVSSVLTANQVSGTASITYSGNLISPAVQGVPRRVTWRVLQ